MNLLKSDIEKYDTLNNTIMVVEDDEGIRETLTQAFELEDYLVKAVPNGAEALSTLNTGFRPAVIFLDLMMPVMDGWQFLTHQRQDKNLSNIPVVIVSAVGDKTHLIAGIPLVRKPLNLDSLLDLAATYSGRSTTALKKA